MSVLALTEASRTLKTGCPYCGTGCGLKVTVAGGRITEVAGDPDHPVNAGATCRKPLRLTDTLTSADRACTPLWRDTLDARWRELTWRQTTGRIARRLQTVIDEHGPDAVAFYISGQLLTEDYYAVNKLAKGFLGTNNVDSNSRLCMSSAVAGYTGAFGSDGPPPSYVDIDHADHIFILGSNTSACHPIIWNRIRRRQAQGATVTVVDPRRTPTAEAADLHLQVRPGADLPLLSAILGCLHADGLTDPTFLERHTAGAEETLAAAAEWTPARAAHLTGIPAEEIVKAAQLFGRARRAMTVWSMGANQSTVGTLKNRGLINLCLATGNIGRPGSGPLSLTGQPNAMGGRETGGLASLLPGYRTVTDPDDRLAMRRLWNIPADAPGISPTAGIPATELVEALESGQVKVVWIVATNPAVSQPDARRFIAALRRAELVIVQDAYHPTETSALAHVMLPAAGWGEKDGTMTSSERRVTLMRRAVAPAGDALPDWEIFARVARALGHRQAFAWRTAAEVHAEYVRCTQGRVCDQSGISHARLAREGSIQWPAPSVGRASSGRLYANRRFGFPDARARLTPTPHSEPADVPDGEFPLVLTTGRLAHQWHTMTRTGKSRDLIAADPEPFVLLHPADAQRAGVREGEMVDLRSRSGRARMRVRVGNEVGEGVAFAPFHWGALHLAPGSGALNAVVARAVDPISRQAELKATAIRIEPVPQQRPRGTTQQPSRHLVVVGGGMAAHAVCDALVGHAAARWHATIIAGEKEAPYNRVQLSSMLAGKVTDAELALKPPGWYAEHEITIRAGVAARAIDPVARTVELADGDQIAYHELVIATGSQPFIPPIPGVELAGVHAFRTRADARAILDAARTAQRAVVIGGGLLGLEAAYALRAHGVPTTVVHLAPHLMEQQLDPPAASLLARGLRALRIDPRTAAATQALEGHQRVERVRLASGETLDADLVVVAAGVRPDTTIAATAGIEVGRGILVDDELRTNLPGIRAVGECAEHRGRTYGLWNPLLQQSRALAASLAEQPTAFLGATPSTTLKVAGIDLFCCGRVDAADDDQELLTLDSRRGAYRRLLLSPDGRLAGAILLGDLTLAGELRALLTSGDTVPDSILDAVTGNASTASLTDTNPTMNVCSCQNVDRGTIVDAIRQGGLTSVREVSERTGAATGCGGCRNDVERLLEAVAAS